MTFAANVVDMIKNARIRSTSISVTTSVPSAQSDKNRAIDIARQVLKYEQSGITILPSETIILSREYLKALGISER